MAGGKPDIKNVTPVTNTTTTKLSNTGEKTPMLTDPATGKLVPVGTDPAKQAQNEKNFGTKKADQPPQLPGQNTPANKAENAQSKAEAAISKRLQQEEENKPTLQKLGNAVSGAASNAAPPSTSYDFTKRGGTTPRGVAPHYFFEDTDNVYFPDFIVYICGANVTNYVKGSLSWSFGLNENINQVHFSLDNSNDRFTLTPENIIFNHFHTGGNPDEFHEYDESAKAKIYLYKNNALSHPANPKVILEPNTPPDDSGGRRFPLSIYATVFHRNDPIRVWVRVSPFDEWIPAFTGYVHQHAMSDNWIDHTREISITAQDIRSSMQKMRMQRNTLFYQLPAGDAASDARVFNVPATKDSGIIPTADDPTATKSTAYNKTFWNDQVRTGSSYQFAWANCSFRSMSEFMTVGGSAPVLAKNDKTGDEDPETKKQIDILVDANRELDEAVKFFEHKASKLKDQIYAAKKGEFPSELYQEIIDPVNGTKFRIYNSTLAANSGKKFLLYSNKRVEDLNGAIKANAETIKKLKGKDFYSQTGWEAVNGVGRMTAGVVLRYPGSLDDTTSQLNKDILKYWYSLCVFGSAVREKVPAAKSAIQEKTKVQVQSTVRYWTYAEITDPITGAGPRCRWDDLWAPDNQHVHWLFPGTARMEKASLEDQLNKKVNVTQTAGTGAEDYRAAQGIEDYHLIDNQNIAGNRAWNSRYELINQFASIVDYKWWVTGTGDIVFEFPMYDFEPADFGPWESVLTIDAHAVSCSLDEEAGDPPVALMAVGSITGNTPVNTLSQDTFIPPPHQCIYSPNMAMRLGMKVDVRGYAYLNDKSKLIKMATLEFQKAIGMADQSSIEFGWRPWLIPNKPIRFVPRERLSLINNVTHTMNIFGVCSTSVELHYTRMLDITGLRRYITGGARQAVSYASVPGSDSTASLFNRQKETTAKQVAALFGVSSVISSKDLLLQLRANSGDYLPAGYDTYNVLPTPKTPDDVKAFLASGQAITTQSQLDARLAAIASSMTSAEARAADGSVTQNGVTVGSTGIMVTGIDVQKRKSNQPVPTDPVSLSPTVLQNAVKNVTNFYGISTKVGGRFSQKDQRALTDIIAGESKGFPNISPEEKIAIAWTALNFAGMKGNIKNWGTRKQGKLAAKLDSTSLFKHSTTWVDLDKNIAKGILTGQIPDNTGGADSLAKYNPDNMKLDDPRLCNAFTGDIKNISISGTNAGSGQIFDTSANHVFIKRNTKELAPDLQKQLDQAKIGGGLPPDYAAHLDKIKAAAAYYRVPTCVILAIMKHEIGSINLAKTYILNLTGDAGIQQANWSTWSGDIEGICRAEAVKLGYIPGSGGAINAGGKISTGNANIKSTGWGSKQLFNTSVNPIDISTLKQHVWTRTNGKQLWVQWGTVPVEYMNTDIYKSKDPPRIVFAYLDQTGAAYNIQQDDIWRLMCVKCMFSGQGRKLRVIIDDLAKRFQKVSACPTVVDNLYDDIHPEQPGDKPPNDPKLTTNIIYKALYWYAGVSGEVIRLTTKAKPGTVVDLKESFSYGANSDDALGVGETELNMALDFQQMLKNKSGTPLVDACLVTPNQENKNNYTTVKDNPIQTQLNKNGAAAAATEATRQKKAAQEILKQTDFTKLLATAAKSVKQ